MDEETKYNKLMVYIRETYADKLIDVRLENLIENNEKIKSLIIIPKKTTYKPDEIIELLKKTGIETKHIIIKNHLQEVEKQRGRYCYSIVHYLDIINEEDLVSKLCR